MDQLSKILEELGTIKKTVNDINIKADRGKVMMDKFAEKLLDGGGRDEE